MKQKEIEAKRNSEKETLKIMCTIYCNGMHKTKKRTVCEECQKLLDYALIRTDKCPFMETKTFCSACKVHCYSGEMQERIKAVMRYAGPRMLWVHPTKALKHMATTIKNKRNNK